MKMGIRNRLRRAAAFTLAEVLIVVAIVGILAGVSTIAVTRIVRNTRQTSLDRDAEVIYVAVQRRLTSMAASGNTEVLLSATAVTPESMDPATPLAAGTPAPLRSLSYLDTENSAFAAVLSEGVIGDDLRQGCYYISFNIETYTVVDVFYTTADNTDYFSEKILNNAETRETMKDSAVRRADGAKLGWYGENEASLLPLPDPSVLDPGRLFCWLEAENAEELSVMLYCRLPDALTDPVNDPLAGVTFTLTVTGKESDAEAMMTIPCGIGTSFSYAGTEIESWQSNPSLQYYAYRVVLDSIKEGYGFREVMTTVPNKTTVKGTFIPGEDIMVRVGAVCNGQEAEPMYNGSLNASSVVNSLFAGHWNVEGAAYKIAEVSAGRHLQNLSTAQSGLDTSEELRVLQAADIHFQAAGEETDTYYHYWANVYGDRKFVPINNEKVTFFDGGGSKIEWLPVETEGDAGLFAAFSDGTLQNIRLVNPSVVSTGADTAAGGLAGRTLNTVQIENCWLYLTEQVTDGKSARELNGVTGGTYAGGLVGCAEEDLSFSDSFASTVVCATSDGIGVYAGGLLGYTEHTLSVERSYADCYLAAPNYVSPVSSSAHNIGGLAGKCGSGSSFDNCYSAGFILDRASYAAGFVPSAVASVTNSYSLFNFDDVTYDTSTDPNEAYITLPSYDDGAQVLQTYGVVQTSANGDEGYHYINGPFSESGRKVTMKKLLELQEDESTALEGFASASEQRTRYDLAAYLTKLTTFQPLLQLADLPHFGDWLEKIEPMARIYLNTDGVYTLVFESIYAETENSDFGVLQVEYPGSSFLTLDGGPMPWDSYKGLVDQVTFVYQIEPVRTREWFKGFTALEMVDMVNLKSSAPLVDTVSMFEGCSNLSTILASENFSVNNVVGNNGLNMFLGCTSLIGGNGTNYAEESSKNSVYMNQSYARIDQGPTSSKPGYFTLKTYAVLYPDGSLVFQTGAPEDESIPRWSVDLNGYSSADQVPWLKDHAADIKSVNFQVAVAPYSTAYWFDGCVNMTSADLSNLAAAKATDMHRMFADCENLTTLTASTLNTAKVADMSEMFLNCSKLTSVPLRNWNTRSVVTMRSMFENCERISGVSVVDQQLPLVEDMSCMFKNCKRLTGFSIGYSRDAMLPGGRSGYIFSGGGSSTTFPFLPKLKDMHSMFEGAGLTSISWTGYIFPVVENVEDLFKDCTALKTVTFGNTSFGETRSLEGMFRGCTSLTTVNLHNGSNWKTTYNSTSYQKHGGTWPYFTDYSWTGGLDVEYVTTTRDMFRDCKALTTVNLAHLDVTNVTDMSGMFAGSGLLAADLSKLWSTEQIENMHEMFADCASLKTVYVHSTNTTGLTDTGGMFRDCVALQKIYAAPGSFPTASVTDSEDMFAGCDALNGTYGTTLEKASNVTDKTYARLDAAEYDEETGAYVSGDYGYFSEPEMVAIMYASGELRFQRGLPEEGVEYLDLWFAEDDLNQGFAQLAIGTAAAVPWDSYRAQINKVTFDEVVTPKSTAYWFYNCSAMTEINSLEKLDTKNATNMTYMFYGCSNTAFTDLDVSHFDTANVTNMAYMFYNCRNVTELDVSGFDTAKVTNMDYMFFTCAGVTELDVSGFDTARVQYMRYMFYACSKLKMLDLSDWSTTSLYYMAYMFYGCGQLQTIFASDQFVTNRLSYPTSTSNSYSGHPFVGCRKLVGGAGTNWYWHQSLYTAVYARIDQGADSSTPGFFTRPTYAWVDASGKTLTFSYEVPDTAADSWAQAKNEYPGWLEDYAGTIETVSFEADVTVFDTKGWFKNCVNLTAVNNIKYLHTEFAEDMSEMFSGCAALTSLDAGKLLTYTATDLSDFFYGCSSLTSVGDLRTWETPNATSFRRMFSGCAALTSVGDLAGWDTRNVTDMSEMFSGCAALYTAGTLDLAGFDTAAVTDMTAMFQNCGARWLDLRNFKTNAVTASDGMFDGAAGKAYYSVYYTLGNLPANSVDRTVYALIYIDDPSVTNTRNRTVVFQYGDEADSDRILWNNYKKVVDMSFYAKQESDYNGHYLPWYRYTVTNANGSTSSYDLYSYIRAIEVADEIKPISMDFWFWHQPLSDFTITDTWGNVTLNTRYCKSMNYAFAQLTSTTGLTLDSLDLSMLDTSAVRNMYRVFYSCTSLKELDLTGWNIHRVEDNMFSQYYINSNRSFSGAEWFANDTALTTIYGDDGFLPYRTLHGTNAWDTYRGYDYNTVFATYNSYYGKKNECTALVGGLGSACTGSSYTSAYYAHVDGGSSYPGYLTGPEDRLYAMVDQTGTVLTFVKGKTNTEGAAVAWPVRMTGYTASGQTQWAQSAYADTITTVRFASDVKLRSLAYWFSGLTALENEKAFYSLSADGTTWKQGFQRVDTSYVTNMTGMLMNSGVTSFDLGGFKTDAVTTMSSLFAGCERLTEVDLSANYTRNLKTTTNMFYGCGELTTIYASSVDTVMKNVTSHAGMFTGCDKLDGHNGTTFAEKQTADKTYALVDNEDHAGYFTEHTVYSNVYENRIIIGFGKDSAAQSSYALSMVMSYYYDESGAYHNNTLGATRDYVYIKDPIRPRTMFGASGCITFDFGEMDASNLESVGSVFFGNTKLRAVNMRGMDWSNVTSMSYMFGNCTGLQVIYATEEFQISTTFTEMFGNWSGGYTAENLVGEKGSKCTPRLVGTQYAHIDGGPANPGYFTHCVYAELRPCDGGCELVFTTAPTKGNPYWDVSVLATLKAGDAPWYEYRDQITGIRTERNFKFRPVSMAYWFADFTAFVNADGSRFDLCAVNLTDWSCSMQGTFQNCVNLQRLDLRSLQAGAVTDVFSSSTMTGYKASGVEDVSHLFENCGSLQYLTLGGKFQTANVKTMEGMFKNCSSLVSVGFDETLDVGSLDTRSVKNMHQMFYGCGTLETVDLTTFAMENVSDLSEMFYGCSNLTTIYATEAFSSYLGNYVLSSGGSVNSENMFYGCTQLVGKTYDGAVSTAFNGVTDQTYARVRTYGAEGFFTDETVYAGIYYNAGNDGTMKLVFQKGGVVNSEQIGTPVQEGEDMLFRSFYLRDGWNENNAPWWYGKASNITEVIFEDGIHLRPASTALWFRGMNKLTTLTHDERLDMSKSTSTYRMFATTSGSAMITTYDLTTWDLSRVTDAAYMFYYRSFNDKLDLHSWQTGSVMDFGYMFGYVTYGKTSSRSTYPLDVSGWDVGNATNLEYMFSNCGNSLNSILASNWKLGTVSSLYRLFQNCNAGIIDVRGWDTSNISNMNSLFYYSRYLRVADLGDWDMRNVTSTASMFYYCQSLNTVYVSPDKVRPSYSGGSMFYYSSGLTGQSGTKVPNYSSASTTYSSQVSGTYARIDDPENDRPGYFTDVAYRVYGVLSEEEGVRTLTFQREAGDEGQLSYPASYYGGTQSWSDTGAVKAVFSFTEEDPFRPYSTGTWFSGCSKLEEIDFGDHVDMSANTSMNSMFNGCSSLTELDLTGWSTSSVLNTYNMFQGCSKLRVIYATDSLSFANVTNGSGIFSQCTVLYGGLGTSANNQNVSYARIDRLGQPGAFTDPAQRVYAVVSEEEVVSEETVTTVKVLTFQRVPGEEGSISYSVAAGGYTSTNLPPWKDDGIEKVRFEFAADDVFTPGTMTYWFYNCTTLKEIDFSGNVDFSALKSLSYTFYGCTALKELSLSNLSVPVLTDVSYMCYGCTSLTKALLPDWSTPNLTRMNYMFYGCSALKDLNMDNWNISRVGSNLNYVITECSGLETVTLKNWQNVYGPALNFQSRASLRTVDLSGWKFGTSTTSLTFWFAYCSRLEAVDLTGLEAPGVTSTYYMFGGDQALREIRGMDTWTMPLVTNTSYMFTNCSALSDMEQFRGLYVSNVTNMQGMFQYCIALMDASPIRDWDVSKVTQVNGMFQHCTSLQSADLSTWDTALLRYSYEMFRYCSSLKYVDLTGWNTSSLTVMRNMFGGCTALERIYVSDGFVTGSLTDSTYYTNAPFENCASLVGGNGSTISIGTSITVAKIDKPGTKGLFTGRFYISFDANGGEGTMERQSATQTAEGIPTVSLNPNTFTRAAYAFAGWSTAPDGEKVYDDAGDFTGAAYAGVTLYALWTPALSFDANGGEGTMEPQTLGDDPLTLHENAFTREGYAFAGWNTEADGSGTAYDDGAEITVTEGTVLYAQWEIDPNA